MRGQRANSEFPSIENLFIYFSGVGGKHRARVIRAINYHSYRLLPFPPRLASAIKCVFRRAEK